MPLTAPLTALLIASCPWVTDPLPPISVLPEAQYEELLGRWGWAPGTTLGMAMWWLGELGQTQCRVYLKEPATAEVACHELRHCVKGHWHLDRRREPG